MIPICDKHGTQMRPSTKPGTEGWYFCPQKEGNGFCKFQLAPRYEQVFTEGIGKMIDDSKDIKRPSFVDEQKIRGEILGTSGIIQAKLSGKIIKEITEEEILLALKETRMVKRLVGENQNEAN